MSGKLTTLFAAQDMTQGSPAGNLIRFSVPLLIGNLAQQLYSTVDSIVVGAYVGDGALAAVGASGPILNLLLVLFMGISVGASVMVSQYFGARDRERLEETVGTTITATVVSSIFIMVVGPLITPPVMSALGTPEAIYDMSCTYLIILFAGIIGSAFYNILSGVMRGAGDTMTPMWISIITTVIIRVPIAYGLEFLTRPEGGAMGSGTPDPLFVSILISWVMGAVITSIAFRMGRWKKKSIVSSQQEAGSAEEGASK